MFRSKKQKMPIVSFDFDGVLHNSVGVESRDSMGRVLGYGPKDFLKYKSWKPNYEIHKMIRKEAQNNKIVIVTARCSYYKDVIMEFLKMYGLNKYISRIYFTCMMSKVPYLKSIKAIRHYEDSPKHVRSIRKAGIDVVQTYPMGRRRKKSNRSSQ